MKLLEFSVTNYRSITTANKITLKDLTVLVGKNNEGKSNLLKALNLAMTTMELYSRLANIRVRTSRMIRDLYQWDRDFPIQFQNRRSGLESIFKLTFKLEPDELSEFKRETRLTGNHDICVVIKFNKLGQFPTIAVPKRGTSAYNQKSKKVLEFISKRICFNYIQAVRTEEMAIKVLDDVIFNEFEALSGNQEYREAMETVKKLQAEALEKISSELINPLKVFLPQLKSITINKHEYGYVRRPVRSDVEMIINDGTPTNINYKGDGIKSLVSLALLKDRHKMSSISIIAIEEPESHLHSGAIHALVDIINSISEKNQVILTTHNPLFVQQNSIKSNIIIDEGKARVAKNIAEIRNILGVLPADNLRNANKVLVVEGENDKVSLEKILTQMSPKLKSAFRNNQLVVKPLNGTGNLSHVLYDLKHCMCNYFVLLDYDSAGKNAANKAKESGLLNDARLKFTICPGMVESEFEDCLSMNFFARAIKDAFAVDINVRAPRSNIKWSERMKKIFQLQGTAYDENTEKNLKALIAREIAEKSIRMQDVIVEQKSGFLNAIIEPLENMVDISE